ncbi:MAG TPA: MlaD family protein [Candidatus Dormibacteraeota bacterium]
MRSKKNLPIFLAYSLISLVTLGYLATQMGGEFFFDPGYRVKAEFESGAQLVKDDDVTIAGLRVGKVDWIAPGASGGAEVGMLIHSQYAPLYKDAHAVVKSKNLLGETYVELGRGTGAAGPIPNGGAINRDNTLTPVEIDKILQVLDQDTRDRLVLLINNLGEATAGNGANMNASSGDLKVLAQALSRIAAAVTSQASDLDVLISSLRKIMETLAAWHAEFRAMITDWDRLMKALAEREQALQGTFQEQSRVMAIFEQALAGNGATSLHGTIAQLPSTLNSTNHYLDDANVVYPQLADNSSSIASLFYELASVMSGIDPKTGRHMWRVYAVENQNSAGLPCDPYIGPSCGLLHNQPLSGPPSPSPKP